MKAIRNNNGLAEKAEYRAVDFAKFAASLLVVAIHIPPLEDCNAGVSHELQQVVCRMAVPFFFLCTGYFLGEKIRDKKRIKEYLFHIIKMYLFWTICYFYPMLERFWREEHTVGENVTELLRRFFFIGSYIQLWYLLATVVAVAVLYLFVSVFRQKEKTLAILAILFYLVGVMENSYRHVFEAIPVIAEGIKEYQEWFLTTRNGIFFGFPFVTAGFLLAENRGKIRQHPYGLWTILFLAAMFAEEALLRNYFGDGSHDMYLFTPAAVICLFLFAAWIPLPDNTAATAKMLRRLSTYLFLLHMLVNFWLKKTPLWELPRVKRSPVHYGVVVGVSLLLGMVFCIMQELLTKSNLFLKYKKCIK